MINSRTNGVSAWTLGLAVCGGVSLLGGCGTTSSASLPEQGLRTIASGSFASTTGHRVTGQARIDESFGRIYVVLDDGFSFDEGEKARIGFGSDGQFDTSTRFTSVKGADGRQAFFVPASINPYRYNEVYVWGGKSREVLGFAALERAPETLTGMYAPEPEKTTQTASAAEPSTKKASETANDTNSTTQAAVPTDDN